MAQKLTWHGCFAWGVAQLTQGAVQWQNFAREEHFFTLIASFSFLKIAPQASIAKAVTGDIRSVESLSIGFYASI